MTNALQKSALYKGFVKHTRYLPTPHSFKFKLFLLYIDLSELDTLLSESVWWSVSRKALACFNRNDFLGDSSIPLDEAVRKKVKEKTGKSPSGPIRMLTHVRYYGYCFNPVTFYYCFDDKGKEVDVIVAEITNTPWKERYSYILEKDKSSSTNSHCHHFQKDFHVSPFMPMEQEYIWKFTEPCARLSVHFENYQNEIKQFEATLNLNRSELNSSSLRKVLLQYPFMTLKIISAIHWQALRLFLKRIPFYEHPKHNNQKNKVDV